MTTLLYNAIQPWAPDYPYSQVSAVVASLPQNNPNLPQNVRDSIVQSALGQLSQNGATAWLNTANEVFGDLAVNPAQQTFCAFLHTVIWFLTIIATILIVMCSVPEPVIVVICPAAAIMGVIAGLLAVIQLFACGDL